MSQTQYIMYEPVAPRRDRIPPIAVLAGLFIVGAVAFASLPGFNYVVKGTGVVLAAAYVFYAFRRRAHIAGEVYAYLAWFVWASMGALIATVPELFWSAWQTVFQIWFLIVILSGFTENRRILSYNLLMFLVAAFIGGGYSFLTGEYQRAEAEGVRVAGLIGSNGFGMIMVLATACMAYFWMQPSRLVRGLKYGLLIPGMAVAGVSVVLSGSRKSLLGLVLFYVAWLFFCYRKEVLRSGRTLLVIVLGLGVGGYGMYRVLSGSEIAKRMSRSWESVITGRHVTDSGSIRIELYREAGRIISENPIMGVGLDHYRVFSPGHLVAHSEYAEIAADTGLVGAAIYFLWYIFLWRRAGKIAKWSPDVTERRNAGLIRAVILVLLALGFGAWFYSSKFAWVIMGSFIGYSNAVWGRIRSERAAGAYEYQSEYYLPADALTEAQ